MNRTTGTVPGTATGAIAVRPGRLRPRERRELAVLLSPWTAAH